MTKQSEEISPQINSKRQEIALLDVDGTIVNGNCTQLFIRFLLDKKLIEPDDLYYYQLLLRNYTPDEIRYQNIAHEAFKILAKIPLQNLLEWWEECFHSEVKKHFNSEIIEKIESLISDGCEIYLASGSPRILLKEIATELGIKEENIIASEFQIHIKSIHPGPLDTICIGIGKINKVMQVFSERGINTGNIEFYTDNLSDLELLKQVGKRYWLGSESDYNNHSMADHNILKFYSAKKKIKKSKIINIQNDPLLYSYYIQKIPLIEKSIESILPSTCSPLSLRNLSGKDDGHWDLEILQKTFFNPVHEYLENHKDRLISLGSCIFLEIAQLNLLDYIPLISIGEFLYLSNKAFQDITNWTSDPINILSGKSLIEISVIGNASLSLLTLPVHNILFNRVSLEPEKKLRLYEKYTSLVLDTLFANGIKLFWEQQEENNNVSYEAYYEAATLLNRGMLQLAIEFYLILNREKVEEPFQTLLYQFSEKAAILIQLEKDLMSYQGWINHDTLNKNLTFHPNSNFLCLHARLESSYNLTFEERNIINSLKEFMIKAGSFEYTQLKISSYHKELSDIVELFPFAEEYKILLMSYVYHLIHL